MRAALAYALRPHGRTVIMEDATLVVVAQNGHEFLAKTAQGTCDHIVARHDHRIGIIDDHHCSQCQ